MHCKLVLVTRWHALFILGFYGYVIHWWQMACCFCPSDVFKLDSTWDKIDKKHNLAVWGLNVSKCVRRFRKAWLLQFTLVNNIYLCKLKKTGQMKINHGGQALEMIQYKLFEVRDWPFPKTYLDQFTIYHFSIKHYCPLPFCYTSRIRTLIR